MFCLQLLNLRLLEVLTATLIFQPTEVTGTCFIFPLLVSVVSSSPAKPQEPKKGQVCIGAHLAYPWDKNSMSGCSWFFGPALSIKGPVFLKALAFWVGDDDAGMSPVPDVLVARELHKGLYFSIAG